MEKQRNYSGYSGQMVVMSELLIRGCNAALPVVDFGTDVFAFQDEREEVARLQVKTGRGTRYQTGAGYSVQFSVPRKQLENKDEPPLFYVLAARLGESWADFIIISREDLSRLWLGGRRFGTLDMQTQEIKLTVQFRPAKVKCSEEDLTPYKNAWERLPPLQPLAPSKEAGPGDAAPSEGPSEGAPFEPP